MAQSTLSKLSGLEIEERDQAGQIVARYITSSTGNNGRIDVITPQNSRSYAKSLLAVFLPAGYPQSVTDDYLEYQIYDSLQAFSSSIAGLLASRAVLEGVGVGDATASPTAALLLSVLQDSMGRVATILFAHRLGTALEPECKMFRLAADVFNDAAMVLDCLSPAFPKGSRVLLLGCASVLRALCGVAAGSAKASLSAHFATQGNLGELNAKDSSQETVISLLGMLAGSLIVSHITTPLTTWSALLTLLTIHLWTNYRAVRAVSMRTLNRQRANIVFSSYLQHLNTLEPDPSRSTPEKVQHNLSLKHRLLSPEEVSQKERIFELDGVLRWDCGPIIGRCTIGVPLQALLNNLPSVRNPHTGSYTHPFPASTTSPVLSEILHIFSHESYILDLSSPSPSTTSSSPSNSFPTPRFQIILKVSADTKTQLKSWCHALLCARALTQPHPDSDKQSSRAPLPWTYVQRSLTQLNSCWEELVRDLEETGWDTENGALETRSGVRVEMGKGRGKMT